MPININNEFLSATSEDIFGDKQEQKTIKKDFLCLRYSPENKHLNNKKMDVDKDSICKKMAKKGWGNVSNIIQRISRSVIDSLLAKYEEEMENDLGTETVNYLREPGRGKDLWKVIYDWLWKYKFLRWLEENFWLCLEKQTDNYGDWIYFADYISEIKKLDIPEVEENKPLKLSLKKPYWAFINLPESDGYLLLLNKGVVSRCVVCPSQAFAIDYELKKNRFLPQKESFTYELGCRFTFSDVGVEKFVAIALEKPLDLPWLIPNKNELAPKLNGKRMEELWQELEKQDNWRVYAQDVEVAE